MLGPGGGRIRDRSHSLVRGLGGQDRAGARKLESGRRSLLRLHRSRANGGRCRSRALRAGPRRSRLASRARARRGKHRGRGRRRGAPHGRDRAGGGARDVRPPGRHREHPHGIPRRARSLARRAHGRQRDRSDGCHGRHHWSSSGWPPRTSSASFARPPTSRARPRSRRSWSSRPSGTRSVSDAPVLAGDPCPDEWRAARGDQPLVA